MDDKDWMTARLRQMPRWSAVTWCAAILGSILVAVVVARMWKPPAPTVDEVLSKVATLDSEAQSKICAHRSNSVAMYREALGHFNCIEIDVHLNPAAGGPPAVYHPPESNNHGLTLESLLAREQLPAGRLWLDVKDLSQDNWTGFLEQLNRLIPPTRRGDIIVETVWSSPDVRQVVTAFRGSGFRFSYYVPTDEARACAGWRTQQCDALRLQVLSTASLGFSHLSFDARAYDFVQSIRENLPGGVKLLTWDLSRSWPNSELLGDVEIYIVNFPSLNFI
jgi:hypothetical protein